MTRDHATSTLKDNYRLDKAMIDYTIDRLNEIALNDFSDIVKSIANSKKFDYLAKLHEALGKCENKQLQISDRESSALNKFCETLFKKLTW